MTTKTLSPYWFGMFSAETQEGIAERMRNVLDGEYFTLVCCNSYDENSDRFTSIEVYPSQRITSPIKPYRDELPGLSWGTPRLSMGVYTNAKTEREGREGHRLDFVRFAFEGSRIEIDQYAPAGYRLRWIFAVERHDAEEQS